MPLFGARNNNSTYVEEFPVPDGETAPNHRQTFIAPGYVETLGSRVLAGRTFDWRDVHEVRTAVVYWPLLVADFWGMEFFGFFAHTATYAVRTDGDPTALLPAVRRAVRDVSPNLPLANVQTLADVVNRSTARTSFTLVLLAIAAAVALLLGIVGLYAVISYTVATRTREIGIRMAVGAARHDVTRMVLERGLVLAGIGVACGLLAAAGLSRLMRTLLFGVAPVDAVTYAATALLLAGVAALASYVPARRAASVDPVRVLRHE